MRNKTGRYSGYIRPFSYLLDLIIVNLFSHLIISEELFSLYFLVFTSFSWIIIAFNVQFYEVFRFTKVVSIINKIRNRAGLIPLTSVTLDQIYKERRLEMAMEHDRWFDIVRTGKASASMSAVGKVFIQGKHELFPIPEEQITLSKGILTQNPNYN